MNLILIIQTIIDNILNPDDFMAVLWIPTIIISIILFLYILLKVSSYLEYQKNNLFITLAVLLIGLVALSQSLFTSTPLIQNFTDPTPSNVRISQVGSGEVIIQWETKKADVQYVLYSQADSTSWFVANSYQTTAIKSHTVLLSDLMADKRYKFKIVYQTKELMTINGKPLEFTLR